MPAEYQNLASHLVASTLWITMIAMVLILLLIPARRLYRSWRFRTHDRRVAWIVENWDRIPSFEVPVSAWFCHRTDRNIIMQRALERMEVADAEERQRLRSFFRDSGLLNESLAAAAKSRGWKRRQALLTIARMRAPESIPLFISALETGCNEVAVDAIRGLGRVGSPAAGAAVIRRISGRPLRCPAHTLESALVCCYQDAPAELLALMASASDALRPMLAKVLAEVATPQVAADAHALAGDPIADVRGAAARILAVARPPQITSLTELAHDEQWFVRLRAVVALGTLRDPLAIDVLIKRLCDTNRLVRLRAAAALAVMEDQVQRIVELVIRVDDRYALQALVSELERSGRITSLVNSLGDASSASRMRAAEATLLAVLRAGAVRILVAHACTHPSPAVRRRLELLLARAEDHELFSATRKREVSMQRPPDGDPIAVLTAPECAR